MRDFTSTKPEPSPLNPSRASKSEDIPMHPLNGSPNADKLSESTEELSNPPKKGLLSKLTEKFSKRNLQ